MKKIIRLVTVIIALLSLFYAFQFVNECRQMHDVFNSFVVVTNRDSTEKCSIVNETVQNNYEWQHLFDNPLPLWINVGEHYIYSAFWKTESKENKAIAVAVGPSNVYNSFYECSVWFDHKNIITSVRGKFSYSLSKWNSSISIYYLYCSISDTGVQGHPYIFVLTYSKNEVSTKNHIPIFHKPSLATVNSNYTAACILPDNVGIGKADIVEFISFHLLIGVTDLVIYGHEIHNGILYKIRQLLGMKNFLRSLSVVPWNFPYYDQQLQFKLIEIDCALRTFGLAKAYAVLEWDQYVVPNSLKPILDVVNINNNDILCSVNLQPQICCLEGLNDKRSESSWPIILKKTHCMNFPFNGVFKVHGKSMDISTEISKDYSSVISLKTYRSCEGLKNLKAKYDHSPFKFLSGLLSSELLRLWNTGSMFV